MQTRDPNGSAGIYGAKGMMMITGSSSARKSRYTADVYVDMIRAAGVSNLCIQDFRVINLTMSFGNKGAFDAAKYKREVCPDLLYTPSGFVGARKKTKRTGALFTMYTNNSVALGARHLPDACLDMHEEIELMESCTVPFGSEEEKELRDRIKLQRDYIVGVEDEVDEAAAFEAEWNDKNTIEWDDFDATDSMHKRRRVE